MQHRRWVGERRTPRELRDLRQANGFDSAQREVGKAASQSSKKILAAQNLNTSNWPRNQVTLELLVVKFQKKEFRWHAAEKVVTSKNGKRTVRFLTFTNYPTIKGFQPTLGELWMYPLELFD
jgi:hypothetical protein